MSKREIDTFEVVSNSIAGRIFTENKSYVAIINTKYDFWQGASGHYVGFGDTPSEAKDKAMREYKSDE